MFKKERGNIEIWRLDLNLFLVDRKRDSSKSQTNPKSPGESGRKGGGSFKYTRKGRRRSDDQTQVTDIKATRLGNGGAACWDDWDDWDGFHKKLHY